MITFAFICVLPIVGYVVLDSLGTLLPHMDWFRRDHHIASGPLPRIAILYPTCDDFDPEACATLFSQTGVSYDVFILDDSTSDTERARIDAWMRERSGTIVRRKDRKGFKGGNINNWLSQYGDPAEYPYVLIVDADERIPSTFAHDLLGRIAGTEYAFVQAVHFANGREDSFFQKNLNLQVTIDQLQLPPWNYKGVPLLIGHGAILNTRHVRSVGGFPGVVSEDIALVIALAEKGLFGRVISDVAAQEVFPQSYASYWKRRRRWVQADTEVLRKYLGMISRGNIGSWGKAHLLLRGVRLPIFSLYWVTCVVLAVYGIRGGDGTWTVSSWWYLALLFFFFPSIRALTVAGYSVVQRAWYFALLPVVTIASLAITPLAVVTGFKKNLQFDPTGSRASRGRLFDIWFAWEVFTGLVCVIGGVMSGSAILTAIGLIMGASPFLRTKIETPLLICLAVIFFGAVGYSAAVAILAGGVPLEYLVPLIVIGLTM